MFEGQPDIGGHAYTWDYEAEDGGHVDVDMGFIFGNYNSYGNMLQVTCNAMREWGRGVGGRGGKEAREWRERE